jgi:hypothetical protein
VRLADWNAARAAEICGLDIAEVQGLADRMITTRPTAIRMGLGLQRHGGAGAAYRAIVILGAVTGDFRRVGGGVLPETAGRFDDITIDLEEPADLELPAARTINMSRLAEALTDTEQSPPVHALVVWNTNPAATVPDQVRAQRGFRRDDLHLTVLEHRMTDTAMFADVLLPATMQTEHLDIHASYGHHYLTLNLPAIDPIGVTIIGARPATVALTVTDASVKEGNTGFATGTFTVRLNAPALDPITVQYAAAPGTATSGVDYVAAQGSLVFTRGQISKTVTVNVIGDAAVEGNETFQLIATATGGATATGTGTILDDDTAFRIDVVFPDSTLTASQRQAFRLAADRWSQIITADLPDVAINGRTIDDLEITATGPAIDGPYGILGLARPLDTRSSGTQLPYTGEMRFDSADLAMMESSGTLTNVILHEMGHALGIGTLWAVRNLLNVTDATNPLYVGVNGLREYRALAGSTTVTGVPAENMTAGAPGTPGDGSYGVHWRESVFRNELMTSVVERAGTSMPISRLTIGSLQDLGYTVNYAAADPYVLPAPAAATNVIRSSTATSSNQRLFALVASSGADFLAAAMRQFGSDSTPTTTPRQRAFAGGVRV